MAGSEDSIVRIESYGCTMNQGEAALAGYVLRSRGYDVTSSSGVWGTILIFTCDVIGSTENRMWRRIASARSSGKRVIVAGCLAAISGHEIKERYPGVRIIDTMGITSLMGSLEETFPVLGPAKGSEGPVVRLHHIVPISTGCLGSCTYCVTKEARGSIRSYPPDQIVSEVRRGVLRGRKEILLTSQDSAAYGLDGAGIELPELIQAVACGIQGDHMFRIGMMNPENILPRLDRIMESFSSERIFKFFHIPLQAGSDRILSMMGRGYSVMEFFRIADAIRIRYPGATISTDMIVGFPSQTEEDHRADMEAVKRLRPDIVNVTRFSPRPGTAAEVMEGRILQRTVKERSREMVSAHIEILRGILEGRSIGSVRVLVTEIGKRGTMMGRDMNYTPIVIKGTPDLLGRWIDVETIGIGRTYLIARHVK